MNLKTTKLYALALLILASAFVGCKDENEEETPTGPKEQVTLEGQITSTKVLDASKIYLMKGYVRVMAGGTLEIPAGTVIKGEKSSFGALIVERGGKIKANGTASNPIVFTSDQVDRKQGDWAGIIICGNSRVNTSTGTATYEGGILGAGVAEYGGGLTPNLADNSGEFTYVRIEFAGYPVQTDKEINGLTLCGVGSGTTVHHVQVSYSADDSFEFFGGTVNATHLVAYRGVDDDFDFDNGYAGKLQYGISFRDPVLADKSISRGIELENKGAVTGDAFTRPVISNFTFLGSGKVENANHGAGIHFGQNSRMVLANSIIANANGNAVEFNTEFAAAELKAGRSVLSNNLVFGNAANYGLLGVTSFPSVADFTTFATTAGNVTIANLDGAGLNNTTLGTSDFTLKTTSPALGKAKFEGDLATGFVKETFIGSMGTSDWTKGWTNWNPKTATY